MLMLSTIPGERQQFMRAASYQHGDALFAEITFSGSIGKKNRPVVVLSVPAFHQAGTKLIVAALTSNLTQPFRPGDTLVGDWQAAGLARPSAMRGLVITVDQNEIIRFLGKLSPQDLTDLQRSVAEIMGLAVPNRNQ